MHGPRHEGMNNEKPGNENQKLVQTNQSVDLLATVLAAFSTLLSSVFSPSLPRLKGLLIVSYVARLFCYHLRYRHAGKSIIFLY
jgi:hypothetical protein